MQMGGFQPFDYFFPLLDSDNTLLGTGALVSAEGHFLTAGHVVRERRPGDVRGILPVPGKGIFRLLAAVGIRHHHEGADVALGLLAGADWEFASLPVLDISLPIGEDVYTYGFVPPTSVRNDEFIHDTRYFKGYVSGLLGSGNQWTRCPTYQVPFEIPRGLSGAPLMTFHNEKCIAGIICGSARTELVEDIEEETEEKRGDERVITRVVSKRIISYGLAIGSEMLLQIPGLTGICRVVPCR